MPGITLKIAGQPNAELVQRIVPPLTVLTCEVLEKRPEQTMVMVQFVPHELWFIDSRSLAELGRNSFRLEVTITDETNTKAQKARYQKEAFALLAEAIGNLHPHSNIHVIDCKASSYGYGGVSQEYKLYHP
ncbi:4-oxalocrotonate tautomerase [Pseudomonas sp. dw_612]|uniref:tautomerase family protein n=1 Tax=Pseudomonas sp. dw_612 TaxID=2720080 RepID=UPI001BD239D3|nr:4-oxalocrotonate tautomerase [Pseudomonas sp. dw_612]